MDQAAFLALIKPHVESISARTGWLPSVQAAQLAWESAWGSSNLAMRHNNLGGIKFTQTAEERFGATNAAGFASYPSLDAFFADYARVQALHAYDPVRAARVGGPVAQVHALAASPYDAGHYGGTGAGLVAIVQGQHLAAWDGSSVNDGGQAADVDSPPAAATPGGYSVTPGAGDVTIQGPGLGAAATVVAALGAAAALLAWAASREAMAE